MLWVFIIMYFRGPFGHTITFFWFFIIHLRPSLSKTPYSSLTTSRLLYSFTKKPAKNAFLRADKQSHQLAPLYRGRSPPALLEFPSSVKIILDRTSLM